ncbi:MULTISPECIES: hypothetical protein [unclassified Microbacterium]|uniref:hypothetical protein n=1 Tax=unclassified Microbacterium TaxID=2609290 RepID=UPI000ED7A5A7|nr:MULTISPECIES: hypothetical protein [unclassified Microbacterium]MBT2485801.1 hypothetical protein [Microbacterium sp. ISL-108]RKN68563.1 hypothetical protein D7252_13875 [Microbacterium sp. CGR2]
MSDVREVNDLLTSHTCEIRGDTYPSMRAAWMCEERDVTEAREAKRPVRHIMRAVRGWEDE